MALKKKVTYSVAYNAETDAINTPLNSLLQQVASLILSQNPGLSVLDTITYGSSRMEDAPLYNNRPDALNADCFANRYYESDVIFIGTDKNNVCLSINFFQGELVVAMNMTPHMEQKYVDAWQDLGLSKQLPFYAVGKASRSFNFSADYVNWYSYTLPYRIVDNAISISVLFDYIEFNIIKRNGKKKLLWIAYRDKALNYEVKPDEMLLTVHRWFAKKSCPGNWLFGKLGDLAQEVNSRLGV